MKLDKELLLFLNSSGLGQGEIDLGEKLMQAFLRMLIESGTAPAKIICMNSGIFKPSFRPCAFSATERSTFASSSLHRVIKSLMVQKWMFGVSYQA